MTFIGAECSPDAPFGVYIVIFLHSPTETCRTASVSPVHIARTNKQQNELATLVPYHTIQSYSVIHHLALRSIVLQLLFVQDTATTHHWQLYSNEDDDNLYILYIYIYIAIAKSEEENILLIIEGWLKHSTDKYWPWFSCASNIDLLCLSIAVSSRRTRLTV